MFSKVERRPRRPQEGRPELGLTVRGKRFQAANFTASIAGRVDGFRKKGLRNGGQASRNRHGSGGEFDGGSL